MTRVTAQHDRTYLALSMQHFVQLFYSEHCFGCPAARTVVRQFAAEHADVAVAELDVAIHAGLARKYGVVATPAVVVDGGRVLYGVPKIGDLQLQILIR